MSYLSSLVLARAGEKEFPMLSSLSSSRVRAVVSLAGVALCLVGFFLPMFTESNPGVPGSAHPVYEWQVVMRLASSSVLAGSFAALSLLGVLIVLATSVAALFAVWGPRLVLFAAAHYAFWINEFSFGPSS